MTREEEIMQEANTRYSVSHPFIDIAKKSFIEGAQWADKTIIEKACQWLKNWAYFSINDTTGTFDEKDLIKRFRAAMEE